MEMEKALCVSLVAGGETSCKTDGGFLFASSLPDGKNRELKNSDDYSGLMSPLFGVMIPLLESDTFIYHLPKMRVKLYR